MVGASGKQLGDPNLTYSSLLFQHQFQPAFLFMILRTKLKGFPLFFFTTKRNKKWPEQKKKNKKRRRKKRHKLINRLNPGLFPPVHGWQRQMSRKSRAKSLESMTHYCLIIGLYRVSCRYQDAPYKNQNLQYTYCQTNFLAPKTIDYDVIEFSFQLEIGSVLKQIGWCAHRGIKTMHLIIKKKKNHWIAI
jgi:hypothetical protein